MFDLTHGFAAYDSALLLDRLALGTFFAISGFHKLWNPVRRASLAETFKADGCYTPANMYAIPGGEFMGGLALLLGFMTPIAAAGLVIICAGACFFDGLKRIKAWAPLDRFDWVDDVLYLPEALYILLLAILIMGGPGRYSLDAYLWSYVLPLATP